MFAEGRNIALVLDHEYHSSVNDPMTVTMPGIVLIDELVSMKEGKIRWDLDGEALDQLAGNFDYEQGIADTPKASGLTKKGDTL